jgi:hypothetical protein
MSMVKFECPSCGQHMETDRARSGDVIHCVGCCSELRIPFSSSKTGLATIERAEMLVPADAPQPSDPKERIEAASSPKAMCSPRQTVDSPSKAIEATCPVCQSILKLDPTAAPSGDRQPIAELVHRHEPPQPNTPPTPAQAAHSEPPEPANHHTLTFEEREKQIAEGRKAHPIQLYPTQKPRLDYIRSGGAKSPSEAEKEHKKTTDCHDNSFSE